MANPEHLEILKQGVEVWNQWREAHFDIIPDLSGANLSSMNFSSANLSMANLRDADLTDSDLAEANIWNTWLTRANLVRADLSNAHLTDSDLTDANLTGATLYSTDLSNATLRGTKFSNALLSGTIFVQTDLREVLGLETVKHNGPSELGVGTLYLSGGKIPDVFLRGCGVPEDFITYMHSLTAAGQHIRFYSCFISYSSKDQLFADRLYADLQNKGVRCWLASEDLKIGEKIRIGIDESIRFHDKLLLVLSKYSVESDWVEQEVETALARERAEKRTVLFPIRLDDTVMKIETGWPALIRNTRNIGDFRKWKNPESYNKALDRLLRDLKAEEKKER